MKVEVQYDVPVSAVVNTETGEVEDVIVWRDAVEPRDGEYAVVDAEFETPVGTEQRTRALEIAESDTWPDWVMG